MGCCSSDSVEVSQSNVEDQPLAIEERKSDSIDEENEQMTRDTAAVLETLRDVPLLASLSETDKRKLAKSLKERTFLAGEKLMKQGDVGVEFFVIVDGQCKVSVSNEDGTDTDIAQLNKGDYCGEQALLQDCTRGATITAVSKSRCFVLGQSAFKQIMKENNVQFAKRDAKREAISAELPDNYQERDESKSTEKDAETTQWLLTSVEENILFSHLDSQQREVVIAQMYKIPCKKDDYLITQGDEGNTFFVVESGELVIHVKDVGQVDSLSRGRCVGELALLYNAPRAASVQATEDCELWAVERAAFRKALMEVNKTNSDKNVEFLKKCDLLRPLLSSELALVDQALEQMEFKKDATVFEKDSPGDRFYLIKSGEASGAAKDGTNFELGPGSFFGERALLTGDTRAATIKCKTDCVFLTLTREDFTLLLGPLEDIMKRNLEEYEKPVGERNPMSHKQTDKICALEQLETVGILGRGAFGTVKLVIDPNTSASYALKAIRKNQVVELGQQSHILNEKKVMQMLDNRFLVNLRNTYRDEWRIYFLLEVCLGGELFTVLRKMRSFDEQTARFYSACVVEAFDYMHQRDVIYRDLKPENLVLTDTGYLKVTDFGFAKVVPHRTFTLCGTPDYLAPEIVTGQGHGKGVDWWTLGILVYEMLSSFPPFFDDEPMMTYRKIIQGKFKFPRYLSPQSKDLISKFLKSKPTKRYGIIRGGADLIRKHPWFADFDWEALRAGGMKVPLRPKVKSTKDMSNFDHFQEKKEDLTYKGDPDLGWDIDF